MRAYNTKEEQARLRRRLESALRLEPEKRVSFLLKAANDFTARALYRERELNKRCNVCGANRKPWGGPR